MDKQQDQIYGHRTWSIVRLFYQALINFRRQYEVYDDRVLQHSRRAGLSRELLRLNSADLAGLLDFKKLEDLRDIYIHELKDLCHIQFRTQDETDFLDRYVSDIFHEISILKEEHYTVKTYAPMYERDQSKIELQYILDEAHAMFPQKLQYILYLFGKATERMEQHLPRYREIPIVIRSLYLHRDGFVKDAYADGIRHFYRAMYEWGPFEGFCQVGLSFYHSGFYAQSLDAFSLADDEYPKLLAGTDGYTPPPRKTRESSRSAAKEAAASEGKAARDGEPSESGASDSESSEVSEASRRPDRDVSRLRSLRRQMTVRKKKLEERSRRKALESRSAPTA